MKRLTISISFGLLVLVSSTSRVAAQGDADAMRERAAIRYSDVPRKVLAFYYPWYYNPAIPDGSKQRMTWQNVDEKSKSAGNATHFPVLGPYDSHDPKLIAQHAAWSKRAGVDGWIVSWWGRGHQTDRAMGAILDACQKAGLEVTVYYETVPQPRNGQSAAKDLLYVLGKYGDHPAWLRVDHKPVLFIYGRTLGEIKLPGWLEAITEVNRLTLRKAVFLGDQPTKAAARVFDGIHTYNTVGSLAGKTLEQAREWAKKTYPAWVETADAQGRISTITVIPGYDDTKIRKPGLRADRMDGALYRCQWEEAIAADPQWVLVTSWNEWYEGSEIEPSAEYGEKYLQLTAEFSARFKSKPRAPRAKPRDAGQRSPLTMTSVAPSLDR
jgi:hypothetical protein